MALLGGGALIFGGSLLPWVTVPLVGSLTAVGGAGLVTLALGAVVVLCGLLASFDLAPLLMNYLGVVGGVGAALFAAWKWSELLRLPSDEVLSPVLGPGLPVIILGGLIAVVSGLMGGRS